MIHSSKEEIQQKKLITPLFFWVCPEQILRHSSKATRSPPERPTPPRS